MPTGLSPDSTLLLSPREGGCPPASPFFVPAPHPSRHCEPCPHGTRFTSRAGVCRPCRVSPMRMPACRCFTADATVAVSHSLHNRYSQLPAEASRLPCRVAPAHRRSGDGTPAHCAHIRFATTPPPATHLCLHGHDYARHEPLPRLVNPRESCRLRGAPCIFRIIERGRGIACLRGAGGSSDGKRGIFPLLNPLIGWILAFSKSNLRNFVENHKNQPCLDKKFALIYSFLHAAGIFEICCA